MKSTVRVTVWKDTFSDASRYDAIVNAYPEGEGDVKGIFTAELDSSSPILERLFELLHAAGKTEWLDQTRNIQPNEFDVTRKFEWEKDDYATSKYLQCGLTDDLGESCVKDNGSWVLDTGDLDEIYPAVQRKLFQGKLPAASADKFTVVSDSFRRQAEEAQMIGFSVGPEFRIIGPRGSDVVEKFWIWGDGVQLPKLSKRIKKVDRQGQPVECDDFTNCSMAPGEYYKYEASDLSLIGEFDVGDMPESAGHGNVRIVSQRFYKLCTKLNVKARWTPVGVLA